MRQIKIEGAPPNKGPVLLKSVNVEKAEGGRGNITDDRSLKRHRSQM